MQRQAPEEFWVDKALGSSRGHAMPTKIWWESRTTPSNQVFTMAQRIYDLRIMAVVVSSSQILL
jgi:hypothetical protein